MATITQRLLLTPNMYVPQAVSTFTLSASTRQIAYVFAFTGTASDTITTVLVQKTSGGGSGQTYRLGIQSVDNTTGLPTGTWLGANNQAYQDITNPSSATVTASLPNTDYVTMTPGAMYAVVIAVQAGTPTAAFATGNASTNSRFPYAATFDGTSWSRVSVQPCCEIRSATASYGTFTPTATTNAYANNSEVAQLFTIPAGLASSLTLSGFGFAINGSVTTGGSIDIKVYTGGATTDTGTVTTVYSGFDSDWLQAASGYVEIPFTTGFTITPGTTYRVAILNSTGGNLTLYREDWAANGDMAHLPLGTGSYLSTRTSGNWTNQTAQRIGGATLVFSSITGGGLFVSSGVVGGMRG